jgi:hypothetical protein
MEHGAAILNEYFRGFPQFHTKCRDSSQLKITLLPVPTISLQVRYLLISLLLRSV